MFYLNLVTTLSNKHNVVSERRFILLTQEYSKRALSRHVRVSTSQVRGHIYTSHDTALKGTEHNTDDFCRMCFVDSDDRFSFAIAIFLVVHRRRILVNVLSPPNNSPNT